MTEKNEKTENESIQIDMAGPIRQPFAKADFAKVIRSGQNFAISFFQLDYGYHADLQNIAKKAGGKVQTSFDLDSGMVNPVGRVVFDLQGFVNFVNEVNNLYNMFQHQQEKQR